MTLQRQRRVCKDEDHSVRSAGKNIKLITEKEKKEKERNKPEIIEPSN